MNDQNGQNDQYTFPYKLDARPMDKGRFETWGYNYSRPVTKRELWRPAVRCVMRDKKCSQGYRIVYLKSGAYYVSDHGRVHSTLTQGIISKRRFHKRRKVKLLTEDGEYLDVRPYRLALDNWIDPPKHLRNLVYSLCDTANHKDGHCWNDHLGNLEYSPLGANVEHQAHVLHRSGRRKNSDKSKSQPKKQKPPA